MNTLLQNHLMTELIRPQDIAAIVQQKGMKACLEGVANYILADYLRWDEFDKSKRVAKLVQAGIYERFVEKLAVAVAAFRVGNGEQVEVQQGPLIDESALQKEQELVHDAVKRGAKVVAGGAAHELGGTFYQPTVLAQVTPDMRIANASEFGLATYFYSQDISRIWRVADILEVGMVGVNTRIISTATAPFGGVKQSGMGREGSRYGIEEYMETKYVCLGVGK